jgi:hypothetical protein
MSFYFMSFADRVQFLGGCIVEGKDLPDAIRSFNKLGIIPKAEDNDGEVLIHLIPEEAEITHPINRLLSIEELEEYGDGDPGNIVTYDIQ